ncbi:MAG: hypothetical protein DRQ47_07545 [Gammaproteobacteria bacterium]|nr:MAG: hypothetical protein DRQ47_07545 [Gammaproteobacteria bacterium]
MYNNLPESFNTKMMTDKLDQWMETPMTAGDAYWFITEIEDYNTTPEFEQELIETAKFYNRPFVLSLYSQKIMNEPWLEAEDIISNSGEVWMNYMKHWYPEEAKKYDDDGNRKE